VGEWEVPVVQQQDTYPVRVEGRLGEPVSRWLWLVKWLLLVPHVVVLAVLWLGFAVTTVLAAVAIVVTGRFPAVLFDYGVGVLRWTWRVQFYGYSALGTDRYPPFTLADVPDHPARLEVERPGRLSRGLVLVKWVLLLPHWLVVGVFVGGGLWAGTRSDGSSSWAAGGLVGLLVLVAAVVLLVTGRLPRSLLDLVLGLDRWVLRVAGYAALMTDRYPPFRLDMGGADPAGLLRAPPPGPPSDPGGTVAPTAPGTGASRVPTADGPRWTTGRVVALGAGALLLLVATAPLLGGAGLLWADRTQREGGWLTGTATTVSTDRYALLAEDLSTGADGVLVDAVGRLRLRVDPAGGGPVFVGVAPTSDVRAYLTGVGCTRITGASGRDPGGTVRGGMDPGGMLGGGMAGGGPARVGTADVPGTAPGTAPGDVPWWTASVQGEGPQTLTWTPTAAAWTVVVMPVDRSAGLTADVTVAATAPGAPWLAGALLTVGAGSLAGGALAITLAVRWASRAGGHRTG
jgi:hypothetical protein